VPGRLPLWVDQAGASAVLAAAIHHPFRLVVASHPFRLVGGDLPCPLAVEKLASVADLETIM
jgi:hypothetical protein